jgi:hypothetical protein
VVLLLLRRRRHRAPPLLLLTHLSACRPHPPRFKVSINASNQHTLPFAPLLLLLLTHLAACRPHPPRFKVSINASENHMSGLCLVAPPFCLVVVEGCCKSAKRWAAGRRRCGACCPVPCAAVVLAALCHRGMRRTYQRHDDYIWDVTEFVKGRRQGSSA